MKVFRIPFRFLFGTRVRYRRAFLFETYTPSSKSVSFRIGTASEAGSSVVKRRRLAFPDPDPVPAGFSAPLQAGTSVSERLRSLPNPDPVFR